ncbi:hypothetical protein [Sediminicoccus sp. KRV36]|uniref:hypothetical protein n=1 Tax=Sediminicoccus sp. KRV36 TaxID=3133721 RepID=UPI00200EC0D2|nr:hypothetical protein [Sediminicoccus rosea]UPY37944.1 hypothetical protein LHU95_04395 [Sediminicoccus rosea]
MPRLIPRRASPLILAACVLCAGLLGLREALRPPTRWSGQDAEFRLRLDVAESQGARVVAITLNGEEFSPEALKAKLGRNKTLRFSYRGQPVMLMTLRLRFEAGDTFEAERMIMPFLDNVCDLDVRLDGRVLTLSACRLASDSEWD